VRVTRAFDGEGLGAQLGARHGVVVQVVGPGLGGEEHALLEVGHIAVKDGVLFLVDQALGFDLAEGSRR
jgi:hypothetical protein